MSTCTVQVEDISQVLFSVMRLQIVITKRRLELPHTAKLNEIASREV